MATAALLIIIVSIVPLKNVLAQLPTYPLTSGQDTALVSFQYDNNFGTIQFLTNNNYSTNIAIVSKFIYTLNLQVAEHITNKADSVLNDEAFQLK